MNELKVIKLNIQQATMPAPGERMYSVTFAGQTRLYLAVHGFIYVQDAPNAMDVMNDHMPSHSVRQCIAHLN